MSNPFKRFFNEINNYSRSDRNALLILSGLIILAIIANIIIRNIDPKPMYTPEEYDQMMAKWQKRVHDDKTRKTLFKFNPNTISHSLLDSLNLPHTVKQNIIRYRKAGGKFSNPQDLCKIYGMNDSIFNAIESYINIEVRNKRKVKVVRPKRVKSYHGYFDPNSCDSTTLNTFGFNRFQTENVLRYRNSGGHFNRSKDLLKIYGIDSMFFKSIQKHIKIKDTATKAVAGLPTKSCCVELNSADSADLVKLKGIGTVYAARIIKYRKLLGGFYSKKQLLEVYNFPKETYVNIESRISVDTTLIKTIRINFAEYNDLLRHPYLNKKQVKAILTHRDKNGAFEKPAEILLLTEIDSVDFEKIRHYFTCR